MTEENLTTFGHEYIVLCHHSLGLQALENNIDAICMIFLKNTIQSSSVSSSIKRKSDLRINIYHVTFKIDGLKLLYCLN